MVLRWKEAEWFGEKFECFLGWSMSWDYGARQPFIVRSDDPDGFSSTLYAYNAEGERVYTVLDLQHRSRERPDYLVRVDSYTLLTKVPGN